MVCTWYERTLVFMPTFITTGKLAETIGYHLTEEGPKSVELWTVFLRTLFIYFFVLVVMRFMGKREIGKLSLFDLVVSIMIADLAVISIENTEAPLLKGLVPIFTLSAIQVVLSLLSLKSTFIRKIMDGKPSILIRDGKIQEKEMANQRYNIDDLMLQLRENNIANVADVELAILETTGKLTVFPRPEKRPPTREEMLPEEKIDGFFWLPIPLIVDGKVQKEGLDKIGKTRFWLKNELQKYGYYDFKEIFFASIDHKGKMYIDARKD